MNFTAGDRRGRCSPGVSLVLLIGTLCLWMVAAEIGESRLTERGMQLRTLLNTGSPAVHVIDSVGVPRVRYKGIEAPQFNPVYTSVYGLYHWQRLSRSSEFSYFLPFYYVEDRAERFEPRSAFLEIADVLVERAASRRHSNIEYVAWEYDFAWEEYRLEEGWVSGMAQGLAIQVLLRAWLLSGNAEYLEVAQGGRNAFFVEVEDGGVTYKDSADRWWYEEYASAEAVESRVLNGMLHAVIALHELAYLGDDTLAAELARKGLSAIDSLGPEFDAGWWSYYDNLDKIANYKYHKVNTGLACYLGAIEGFATLTDLCDRWTAYREPFIVREFMRQRPSRMSIVVLSMAGIIAVCVAMGVAFLWLWGRRLVGGWRVGEERDGSKIH